VSAVVAVIAGLVAGVLPAWLSRKIDLASPSVKGGRSMTLSRAALGWQRGMVVMQAALSVVILSAAALVGVSFRNLQRVPGGFSAPGAIVARVQVDPRRISRRHVARKRWAERSSTICRANRPSRPPGSHPRCR
jgi:hypothetical protein